MGKKQKDETPNVNLTPNRDIIQRLNFLYQASVYLQSIEPPNSVPDTQNASTSKSHPRSSVKYRSEGRGKAKDLCGKKGDTSRLKVRRNQTAGDLARSYIQCMRVVGQKTTVKMYEKKTFSMLIFLRGTETNLTPFLKRPGNKAFYLLFMQYDPRPRFIRISAREKYVFKILRMIPAGGRSDRKSVV